MTASKTSFSKGKLEAFAHHPCFFFPGLKPPPSSSPFLLSADNFTTFFDKKIGKIHQFLSSTPFPHYMFRIPLLILWHIFLLYYQTMQIILSCNSPTCPPSTVPQTISPLFLLLLMTLVAAAFKTAGFTSL